MPRIRDEWLECVVYLYPDEVTATARKRGGGSGFLIGVPSIGPKLAWTYVVTARHVVDRLYGASEWLAVNTKSGGVTAFHIPYDNWHFHEESDIAIAAAKMPKGSLHKYIAQERFISEQRINDDGIGPGDDIFLVGRLITSAGKQKNTPSVRFGHVAMMPLETVRHRHYGDMYAFQCEIKSIGGYSGSPVFVYIPPMSIRPGSDKMKLGWTGPYLLGVDWGHTDEKNWNTGITHVAPAWDIASLLDQEELKRARQKWDDDLRKQMESCETVIDSDGAPDVNQIAKSVIDRISEL